MNTKFENLKVREETTIEKVKDEDEKVTTYRIVLEHVPAKDKAEDNKYPKITITSDEPLELKHGMKGITITVNNPQQTLKTPAK